MAIKNIEDLRDFLGETLDKLSKGKIEFEHANAVSKLSDSIVQTVKTELEYSKLVNSSPNIKFLGEPLTRKLPKQLKDK